jgi:hypothetical protein
MQLQETTAILQNVAIVVSIIIGGSWTLFTFFKKRVGEWNIEIIIKSKITDYLENSSFVLINFDIVNCNVLSRCLQSGSIFISDKFFNGPTAF